MKQLHLKLSAISLAALLLAASAANAERTFKWVDAEGNTHYGDRVPIQAVAQQRREINEQGRTLKAYAEPASQEALAEQRRQAALEYERQQQSQEQLRQDSELLATYASETDILIARDNELGTIEELIRMTNIRIGSLQKRLGEMAGEAASYEQRGKPVPEFVQHQTALIQEQIDQNEAIISAKQAEMDSINKRYAADIAHYQRLQNHRLSAR